MSRRLTALAVGVSAVPLAFALGGLAARWALLRAPARIAVDLAQPLPVVTAWQGFGAALWAILALTVLAAAGATAFVVFELRRHPPPTLAALCLVFVASGATLASALSWPVVFSSDVYAYAAYGDVAARGGDPYAHPLGPAGGGVASASAWQWGGTTPACVYGPAFVAVARATMLAFGGGGVAGALLAFRVTACLAFLVAAAALYVALPGTKQRRLAATAAFALNPVALWCVAEGHNDALMLALALGGAALARLGVPVGGGVAVAIAGMLKLPGIAVGAGVAALAAMSGGGRVRFAAGRMTVGALLVAPAAAVGLAGAVEAASGLRFHGHYLPQYSLQALGAAIAAAVAQPVQAQAAGIAGALVLCGAIVLTGLRAVRSRDPGGLAWLAIAAWLAIPNPYPWYGLWVLPIAVAALDQPQFLALLAATISIVLRYLPDAFGNMSHQAIVIIALEFAPLLWAIRALPAAARVEEAALQ
jgi:hypothetical protein